MALLWLFLGGCRGQELTTDIDTVPIHEEMQSVAVDLSQLRAAVDEQVADCMAREGFASFPRTSEQHLRALDEVFSVNVLGLSPEVARVSGYGDAAPAGPDIGAVAYFESLTQPEHDAYTAAHVGDETIEATSPSGAVLEIPAGGCVGQASVIVYGSSENYRDAEALFNDMQQLMGEVVARAETGEDFQSALGRWRSCMAAAGHTYASPVEARHHALRSRPASGEAPADEFALASADASCQEAASLRQALVGAAMRTQRDVVREKERLFLAWRELMARIPTTSSETKDG